MQIKKEEVKPMSSDIEKRLKSRPDDIRRQLDQESEERNRKEAARDAEIKRRERQGKADFQRFVEDFEIKLGNPHAIQAVARMIEGARIERKFWEYTLQYQIIYKEFRGYHYVTHAGSENRGPEGTSGGTYEVPEKDLLQDSLEISFNFSYTNSIEGSFTHLAWRPATRRYEPDVEDRVSIGFFMSAPIYSIGQVKHIEETFDPAASTTQLRQVFEARLMELYDSYLYKMGKIKF
jgi:hypothetical protein